MTHTHRHVELDQRQFGHRKSVVGDAENAYWQVGFVACLVRLDPQLTNAGSDVWAEDAVLLWRATIPHPMVNTAVGYDEGFLVELTAGQKGLKLFGIADLVVCVVIFEEHLVDYVSDLCQECKPFVCLDA